MRGADRRRSGHGQRRRSPCSAGGSTPTTDVVEVDGAPVGIRAGLVYYLLNKPRRRGHHGHGHAGPPDRGRARARPNPRVFPVGRLDVDTEGLLLLTNDGELAHRITHPSHGRRQGVPGHRRRRARSAPGALRRLRDGVELDDGTTAPAKVSQPTPGRAADHHPRGPQPPGAADVRGRRAPGRPASCGPASVRCRTAAWRRARGAVPDQADEVRAPGGRRRPT